MPEQEIKYEDLPKEAHEAVHAERNAAQAREVARAITIKDAATSATAEMASMVGDIVRDNLEHVLAKGTEQERSIILARVPYICQDIKGINTALEEIVRKMDQVKSDLAVKEEKNEKKYMTQEQFGPYKWVFGIVGSVIITGIVGALLAQIIIK